MNRRDLLRASASAALIACTEPLFASTQPAFWSRPRTLWIRRLNGAGKIVDEIRDTYQFDGRLNRSGYEAICRTLRDVEQDVSVQISTTVLDILFGTQGWLMANGIDRPLLVHSGYRTKITNTKYGGQEKSWHLSGRAVDFEMGDIPIDYLGNLAIHLRGGGVGIYQKRSFVHVDDGPVDSGPGTRRIWRE